MNRIWRHESVDDAHKFFVGRSSIRTPVKALSSGGSIDWGPQCWQRELPWVSMGAVEEPQGAREPHLLVRHSLYRVGWVVAYKPIGLSSPTTKMPGSTEKMVAEYQRPCLRSSPNTSGFARLELWALQRYHRYRSAMCISSKRRSWIWLGFSAVATWCDATRGGSRGREIVGASDRVVWLAHE